MKVDRQVLLTRLFERLYGNPVVRNDLRGELAEEIVALALEPDWSLCGGDWAAWDLVHEETGTRMQIKQSAALQSWSKADGPIPKPRFSIAETTGRWEGWTWIARVGRNADVYVFAWHPVVDPSCDHADVGQWRFYVVPESTLPKQKTIGLAQLEKLAAAVDMSSLRAEVARLVPVRAGDLSTPSAP